MIREGQVPRKEGDTTTMTVTVTVAVTVTVTTLTTIMRSQLVHQAPGEWIQVTSRRNVERPAPVA
jgi:hypothetical protein